jgi:hypothetical protein
MSRVHGASIIREGLVLHLDAANTKSYPGSGTIWSDLSGNQNDGTLVNGVGFSSDNKGALVFDGVNDWGSLGTSNNLIPQFTTISLFLKLNSYSSRPHLFGRGEGGIGHFYMVIETSGVFRFYNDIGSGWSFLQPLNFTFPLNVWYNIICTFDGLNVQIYGNSVLLAQQSRIGQLRQYTTNETKIGRILTGSNYINGSVSNINLYNRALTAAEIRQNFEGTRGRYGI